MGILDDAMGQLGKHADMIEDAVEKVGDFVDDKTGGKYADQIDEIQEAAGDWIADQADKTD